ncbi:MAG: MFS transporter [Gammaproteobacteria bacterium]|nr:MFS transporter [Gammaproteobacteria bacterium]
MWADNSAFTDEFRQNWRMLTIAFACLLFAFSAPLIALPFLFGPVMDEFGWTREQVTLLASAKFATGAVFSIIAGRFIDVVGVRRTLIFVSTAGALALLSFLWTPNLTVYYLSGILLGIAAPGTIVAVKVLISRTFHASQGTAMGAVMISTSIGSIVFPVIITALIAAVGWRMAIASLSLGIWCITLPLLLFCCDEKSFGLAIKDTPAKSSQSHIAWNALARLIRMSDFWLIALAVMMAGFVDQAIMQHQVLYLSVDLNMKPTRVAAIVSAIGLVGIVGRIVVGNVFDRTSTKGVSLMYMVLAVACLFALGLLNPYVLAAFVVFRAIGHSAVLLDTTVLTKHRFGLGNIGVLLGIYTAMVNIGFALGPWVVARMYETSGSYAGAFVLCAVVATAAAAILMPVQPRYWQDMRKRLNPAAGSAPQERTNG